MTIETTQTSNATPNRNWDWCATFKGYEPDEPIGYGATAELATEDLLNQTEKQHD